MQAGLKQPGVLPGSMGTASFTWRDADTNRPAARVRMAPPRIEQDGRTGQGDGPEFSANRCMACGTTTASRANSATKLRRHIKTSKRCFERSEIS